VITYVCSEGSYAPKSLRCMYAIRNTMVKETLSGQWSNIGEYVKMSAVDKVSYFIRFSHNEINYW